MQANCFIDSLFSNENNSNSAPALGAGGRGFESRYPDNYESPVVAYTCNDFFIACKPRLPIKTEKGWIKKSILFLFFGFKYLYSANLPSEPNTFTILCL